MSASENHIDDLSEYLRAKDPDMREKAYVWKTAIGLQQVDGLKPSEYLVTTAKRNIEGEISLAESRELVTSYHKAKKDAAGDPSRTMEADLVSQHIAEVLSEQSFTFSPAELVSIHRRLFEGVFKFAGKIRDYDITKSEWILKGDTVHYGAAYRLIDTLAFDFEQERGFSYVGLSTDETIRHIARFTSNLWQIHAFGEGNTRTTGVFVIKYLRTLGFDVRNDVFAENAWYFRNALVRANYTNVPKGIEETTEYLELFFRNLLLGEQNELMSRYLVIGGWKGDTCSPTCSPTCTHTSKADTHTSKQAPRLALSDAVRRLLLVLDGEMTRGRIMSALKLKNRSSFLEFYLSPALRIGFIEMTQPDSPRSPTQKYRLTAKGLAARGDARRAKKPSCVTSANSTQSPKSRG